MSSQTEALYCAFAPGHGAALLQTVNGTVTGDMLYEGSDRAAARKAARTFKTGRVFEYIDVSNDGMSAWVRLPDRETAVSLKVPKSHPFCSWGTNGVYYLDVEIDTDGSVRVFDPIAEHFTRCHGLTAEQIMRARRLVHDGRRMET